MYRFLIAGCGYVGTRIATHFSSKKQKVWGLIQTDERKAELEKFSITPFVADLTQPESLKQIPAVNFVIIAVSPRERNEVAYRKIYLTGVENLLSQLKKSLSPPFIIYLSSTGVYGDQRGEWVDEKTPPQPNSERGKILLKAEEQVIKSGLPGVILRLGGIYGPGRNRIEAFRKGLWPAGGEFPFSNFASGEARPHRRDESRPGQGRPRASDADKYMNFIHVDDIVNSIPVLLNKAETGKVYLGVDDEPVKQSEFCTWLAEKLKIPYQSKIVSTAISGKRCRNARLKSLGVQFRYPTFREGYSTFLKHDTRHMSHDTSRKTSEH